MREVLELSISTEIGDELCYHCGDENPREPIQFEDKHFCCQGCKMVYSILSENDLCNFYSLNKGAGTSQRNTSAKTFEFLDDQETITRLINFTDGIQTTVDFYIPQIHCSSCLWLLEHLYRMNPGIMESRVNFLNKEIKITYRKAEITLRQLVELLSSIGYEPYIQLNDLEEDNRPTVDKSLFYKLGLAGFAFGNIMLFSFPAYLGLSESNEHTFNTFFSYLNLVLIIPVILYSGRDYFRSALQGLRQRHLNIDVPVSLGILALFGRSVFEIVMEIGPGYLDTLAGLIFFLLIGKWFQQATYARISFDRDYKSYFPIACTVRRNDKLEQLTLDKLTKNDVVIIHHGELIPADGLLVEGTAKIDYSFVTGESSLIQKQKGELLYAGGKQMGGVIELVVTKRVANSYLTQLWNDQSFTKSDRVGKVSALADQAATFFTWVILLVATITFIYWVRLDPATAFNAFTSVLIIACPCAVALSIPFTFGNVIRIMSRNKVYFKNIGVIEVLAKINHIVFDKTGTITEVASQNLEYQGIPLNSNEIRAIHALTHQSTHPLSKRIHSHLDLKEEVQVDDFHEIKGQGIKGIVDDQPLFLGSTSFVQLKNSRPRPPQRQEVHVRLGEDYKGVFLFKNIYRKGMHQVIDQLGQMSNLSLLSGDNDAEKESLSQVFPYADQLRFDQKPKDKLEYIRMTAGKNECVAMIGDGLNDAGALAESDVGIVITEDTSNFTPACDIIMDSSRFSQLPDIFNLAKISIQLIFIAYTIALLYNIIGLSFAVQGILSPVIAAILMPLSSVTIVLFGVIASKVSANRLGFH